MKRFEKNLRGLIARDAESGILETVPNEHLSEAEARELKALGLVSLAPAGDNLLYVQLTDAGRVYFFRKAESVKAAWLNRLIGAAMTIGAELVIFILQGLLSRV